jgi:hypothetical protein
LMPWISLNHASNNDKTNNNAANNNNQLRRHCLPNSSVSFICFTTVYLYWLVYKRSRVQWWQRQWPAHTPTCARGPLLCMACPSSHQICMLPIQNKYRAFFPHVFSDILILLQLHILQKQKKESPLLKMRGPMKKKVLE